MHTPEQLERGEAVRAMLLTAWEIFNEENFSPSERISFAIGIIATTLVNYLPIDEKQFFSTIEQQITAMTTAMRSNKDAQTN